MREERNVRSHSTVWNFLTVSLVAMGVLSASLTTQVSGSPQKLTVQPAELFNRAKIDTASSTYDFLDNTVDKAIGVCNIPNAKLPTYNAFIFNRIKVGYSGSLINNSAATQLYNDDVIKELRNAEVLIEQNGRVVVDLPFAAIHNPHQTTGNNINDQYLDLGSMAYLVDDTEFTWKLKFAPGVTIPTGDGSSNNYNYLEMALNGHKTTKKSS